MEKIQNVSIYVLLCDFYEIIVKKYYCNRFNHNNQIKNLSNKK